jgi:hypothetical protein
MIFLKIARIDQIATEKLRQSTIDTYGGSWLIVFEKKDAPAFIIDNNGAYATIGKNFYKQLNLRQKDQKWIWDVKYT